MTRTAGRLVLALALLASAVFIWSKMPTKLQSWAPIVERGGVGERIIGRNLTVTVHSAALGHELSFTSRGTTERVPTTGVWLVLDISYQTNEMFDSPTFALDAGGRHSTAYYGGFSGPGSNVNPGMTKRAPVAFEIPEKTASATVLVSNKVNDRYGNPLVAPLDSQIAVPLDLAATPITPTIDLDLVGR